MPPKGPSAKERKRAQKALELAARESLEAVGEGDLLFEKVNIDKGTGLNNLPKAAGYYTKAIELNPNNETAYLARARCMKAMLEYDKAVGDYSKAIELNPQDVQALSCRAYCFEQLQDWDAAIADYSAVIQIQPDDDHSYNMRGAARANKRPPGLNLKAVDYRQVIADFTKATELNECNFYAFANKGNARCDRGEYLEAIEDYSRALYIKDDYWYTYSRRGVAYYEYVLQQRTPKACDDEGEEEQQLQKEVERNAKPLKDQWEDEFWEEEQKQRRMVQEEAFLAQAVTDFTVFLKHEEKEKGELDMIALVNRARVYLLQGNLDEALKDFKKAKELDPDLEPLVSPQIDSIREQTGVRALVHAES